MKCPLCGSPRLHQKISSLKGLHDPQLFEAYKCLGDCRVGFLHPQVSFQEAQNAYYNADYHAYQAPRTTPKNKLKERIKSGALSYFLGYGNKRWYQIFSYPFFLRMSFYPRHKIDGSVLDVGSGAGKYLHYLKRLGWKVYGVDISQKAVQVAKISGLENITQGTLTSARYPEKSFDVVNLHHVLEHVPDPVSSLKETRRILKPGGQVIITLPNYSSLAAKIFHRYWGGLDVPRHLWYFNKKSLQYVLEKAGFGKAKQEFWFSDTMRGCAAGLSYLFFTDGRKYEKYFLPPAIALDLIIDPIVTRLGTGDQVTVKACK